ncbi:helix-turn-helix transcriptional regulator [Kribbella qitaiheensis]|uniref:Helix-turn-helix transcriptional regulator n=1 Tax=Kribbella qitaiheensis TaxID=1544730 RepID=A0A7G6X6B0_9ACTN|nr:helix-turn-helix domain-containing protein [Kribbella qitaiheensis]QNE21775.1 helix-turn-helix transcriptional regulator [Kribbella qitaiheensis]
MEQPRRIDARSLRGLAHPLRMTILEVLQLDGPATSTTLSSRLGESTGTISWHLRLLAEHGYIEEDVERGTKRERWWRAVPRQTILNQADFVDDPETKGSLQLYLRQLVQLYFDRVQNFVDEDWDGEWQHASEISDWRDLRLTKTQLRALNAELGEVINRHKAAADTRAADAQRADGQPADTETPADALPVVVQIQSFPRRPTG